MTSQSQTQTREIQLELDALGNGTCVIDGIDLSDQVGRVTFDSRAGQPTMVYLEAKRGGVIQAQGLVLDRTGGVEEVLQFLRSVDPQALEVAALELLGLDGSADSIGGAMLAVLQGLAVENADDGA
jgi:hypothetical protein